MNAAAPLLLDLTHTCHTRARTGIQRVTRSLHAALGDGARAITHDRYLRTWRELAPWERLNLSTANVAAKRGAQWPLAARVRHTAKRWLGHDTPALPANRGVVVPEVFSVEVAHALPALFARTPGPRVALFHDAIALKFPELSPAKTVARFPSYLVELLAFDGIAAVSADSRDSLLEYWRWLGVGAHPSVRAIPLGTDQPPPADPPRADPANPPTVLSVGTIEGRKNHLALLDACERLWADGTRFSLHLIGSLQAETGVAATARLKALQAAGRPLRYDGAVSDAALATAYAACTFTVYPSVLEGFGLPVIESLVRGKPCICSALGALGEISQGGGCIPLATTDAAALADAISRLLAAPAEVAALAAAARARHFRTWADYAHELTEWLGELPRRPPAG